MNICNQLEHAADMERSQKALIKVKRQEERKIARGYRYVTVGRAKVLVECDGKGRPTERGRHQMESMRQAML